MIDLISGQTKLMFGGMIGTVTHVRSGRLKTIAISSATRSAAMPQVPTVAESGYPDYEATTWYGVLAPAGTPRVILQKLNTHVTAAVNDPKIQQRIASLGAVPDPTTLEEFAAYIKSEETKWAKVVKGAGVRVD
jgi:tripartite-type tricarboxylate transporter receptor subunit TctC